jgi:hypothetical protein
MMTLTFYSIHILNRNRFTCYPLGQRGGDEIV